MKQERLAECLYIQLPILPQFLQHTVIVLLWKAKHEDTE